MKISILRVLVIICLLCSSFLASSAQAVVSLSWQDLIDPKAAQFEDPYAALSGFELRSLGNVLRLRQRLSAGDLPASEQRKLEKSLLNEEAKLAASGVQTDQLLAQRKTVALQRAKAALAGNKQLAGKNIAITGYVIPVLDNSGAALGGYLVPEFGMCSHMPAPNPNQMIRYRLADDWKAAEMYKPVILKGRLELVTTRQTITLLDGQVEMIAAFEMHVSELQPLEHTIDNEYGGTLKDRIFRFFKHD
ncbi:MAG: DUF3299 domain-containing protein [Rhodobacteraceae bacterium]|nr:DUF3299 domain-containing protein [Paracoccaceae bacterium]